MLKPIDAYLMGYYGSQNAGDDALLYATSWAAKNLLNCKKLKVSVFGESSLSRVAKPLNPTYFKGHERLQHYKVAVTSKRLIVGGGSVFQNERDIQLKRHLIGLTNKKKSMAVGVSIGPFANTAAEKACQGFLNEVGFVGVTDEESYDVAKSLAPKANVRLTFDLAPLLLNQQPTRSRCYNKNGIAFNFCQLSNGANASTNETDNQVARACELIQQVWNHTGESIHLVDFNNHPVFGDQHIHRRILAKLPGAIPAAHINYCNDPLKLMRLVNTFKAMIGMRLHATMFSYLTETPCISLHYHAKCKSLSERIMQPTQYQFNAEEYDPLTVASLLTQGLENENMMARLPIELATEKSLSNWSNTHDTYTVFNRNTTLQQA